ncbi:MAG: chromophore lyase CpcT/CpeT [Bacteroidota bacterium]
MKVYTPILVFVLLGSMVLGCSSSAKLSRNSKDKELNAVYNLMQGTFSSREQAASDTSFFDINLVMYPIWENRKDAKWLYVEQAVTRFIDRPYRQRVYRLSLTEDGLVESRVYALPNPSTYIHAWDDLRVFQNINPDSLLLREGCSVYLKKGKNGCFEGATKENSCGSTLRGATFASSEVKLCAGEVVSWDRGWDEDGQQVWGAEKGGYIFKKIP